MRRAISLAILVIGTAAFGGNDAAQAEPPSAQQLLDDVVALMPRTPLFIAGEIRVKDPGRKPGRILNVEVFLDLGATPAAARYTIRDAFGATLEQMIIFRMTDEKPKYEYAKGDPLQRAKTPNLSESVQDTDISWSDLTLSFLWWKNGTVKGTDKVKGHRCFVVEVRPPRDDDAQVQRSARLWITEKHRMLLQAEEYRAANKVTRRLSVKSLKKIDNQWMIKDLVVESFPSRRKTFLRVREMQSLAEE